MLGSPSHFDTFVVNQIGAGPNTPTPDDPFGFALASYSADRIFLELSKQTP